MCISKDKEYDCLEAPLSDLNAHKLNLCNILKWVSFKLRIIPLNRFREPRYVCLKKYVKPSLEAASKELDPQKVNKLY